MKTARGFTLLEVLIATVAFAIVLAAINGVFYGALRLRNASNATFDAAVPLEQTLSTLKRDLANIVPPGGTLSGTLQTTPTSSLGNSGSTGSGTVVGSVLLPGQVGPAFYTATGVVDDFTPFAEVQKVAYLLLESTNRSAGRDLYRAITRNLLPALAEQPMMQPLMTNVQAMTFFYYDGTQWRTTWDSATADPRTGLTNVLPQAIKVQLALADQLGGRVVPEPIELVVPVVSQVHTNQPATSTQTGGGQL